MKQYIFSMEAAKHVSFTKDECGVGHATVDMAEVDKPIFDQLGQGDEIVILAGGKPSFRGTITIVMPEAMRLFAVEK